MRRGGEGEGVERVGREVTCCLWHTGVFARVATGEGGRRVEAPSAVVSGEWVLPVEGWAVVTAVVLRRAVARRLGEHVAAYWNGRNHMVEVRGGESQWEREDS